MKLFNSTVFLLIIFFLTSISHGLIIPRQCGRRCPTVIYFIFLHLLRGIRLLINIINVTKQVPIFDAFREQYVVWALPAFRLDSVEIFQNNNKAIIIIY